MDDYYDYGRFDDFMADEAMYEAMQEDLYPQAIEEFQVERLQSYYADHRDLMAGPIRFVRNSKELLGDHPTFSLVAAVVAIEVGIKAGLLRPIVHGLVHQVSMADVLTDPTRRKDVASWTTIRGEGRAGQRRWRGGFGRGFGR